MTWTETAGFVTGAVCVWLVVRRNIWNFPVGIANNVLFAYLFLAAGLYADAGLQVVYVALAAVGWYWWMTGGSQSADLEVSRASPAQLAGCVAAVGVVTALLQWVLLGWTDSTVADWDALTTALSLTAQFMLSPKWVENWWLWITADVVYVPLYAHKGLWLTSCLYLMFLALCVVGLLQWRTSLRAAATPAVEAEPAR